jgi:dTDP-4-amino-4,6-dideoxygalactose transaminase
MGMPCDLKQIFKIAQKYSLSVVEDAACALGSEIFLDDQWQQIGNPVGDIACFSFHPRKVISTGDGGMITTSNKKLDQTFRLLRQHCMSIPDAERHGSKEVIFESYNGIGYNYRLTDIQASIGREQLKKIDQIILNRRKLSERYRQLLSDIDGLILPEEPPWAKSNWQSFCIYLPNGLKQKDVMQYMLNHGVSTRRGIMCSHMEAEHNKYLNKSILFNSEYAQDHSIILPLFPQMTEQEQNYVCDIINMACKECKP